MNNHSSGFVVFDLDGTLLDTSEGIISAAIYTIKKYKKPVPDRSLLLNMIGPPIQESFKNIFNLSSDEAMKMSDSFREIYKTDEYLLKAVPYEGIFSLWESLIKAGKKIGVATYKREDYAKRILIEKGFGVYTDYLYGSDLEGKLKKKDIIKRCLSEMKCIDCSEAVYVGDGKSDGIGANPAGIPFLAVTYGFGFKSIEDTAAFNPIGVAKSCFEIGDIII